MKPGAYCEEVSTLKCSFFFLIYRMKSRTKNSAKYWPPSAQVVKAGSEGRTPAKLIVELRREEAELKQKQATLEEKIPVLVKKRLNVPGVAV